MCQLTLLRHPVYDCAYFAFWLSTDLRVVTADRRFVGAARADAGLGRHVVPLAELGY